MNLSQHQYPSKVHMRVQNYYYMPLLHLLGFNWVFGGVYDLLTLTYKGEKLPESYVQERNISLALRVFFFIRRFGMRHFLLFLACVRRAFRLLFSLFRYLTSTCAHVRGEEHDQR